MTDNDHHSSGHVAVWIKAPPMVQEILVNADPKRFFVPPYMGPKGWVGVRLDYKVDWNELGEILKDGYVMSAPKRLRGHAAAAIGDVAGPSTTPKQRRSASMARMTSSASSQPSAGKKSRRKTAPR
jgi:YjbR